MDQRTAINLECIFCRSTQFQIPSKNYKPQQGELLKCENCGKLNDFEKIVHAKGKKWVKDQADNIVRDLLNKMNKSLKLKI